MKFCLAQIASFKGDIQKTFVISETFLLFMCLYSIGTSNFRKTY